MQEFLNLALSFPTIFWSALVGLVLAYWVFVIVGALDLEVLDIHLHLEPDLDFDIDVDVDADVDADLAASGISPLAQLAVALGIGKVPVAILLTFFAFSGWMVSYFGMLYLAPLLKFGAVSALILGASFALSVPVMGALAHPLKKVFTMTTRHGGAELIGQTCDVTTGSVDERFGQAKIDDGGAGLLLAVRCDSGNRLRRRSKALIIDFDADTNIYTVEPYEQFLASDHDADLAMPGIAIDSDEFVHAKQEG